MRRVQAGMFGKTVSEIKAEKSGVMGAVTCVLDDDMLTVKTQPKHILPYKTKGTPFESKIYPFGREGKSTDCIILYILPSTGMNSVMPPAAIRTGTLHTAALSFLTATLVLTGARKRTESIIRPQITAVSKKLAVNGMCFITDRRTGAITVVRRVPSAYKFCPTAAFHRLKSRHADSTAAA